MTDFCLRRKLPELNSALKKGNKASSCICYTVRDHQREEANLSHKWLYTFIWPNRLCSWRCSLLNLSSSVWFTGEHKNLHRATENSTQKTHNSEIWGNTKCTRWAIWSLNEVIRTGGRETSVIPGGSEALPAGQYNVSEWVQHAGQIIKKCFSERDGDLFECDWCLSTGGACDCSAHTSLVVISGAPSLSRFYVCFCKLSADDVSSRRLSLTM